MIIRIEKFKSVIYYFLFTLIIYFPTYLFSNDAREGQKILYIIFPIILILLFIFTNSLKNYKLKIDSTFIVLFSLGILQLITVVSKIDFIEITFYLNHLRILIYAILYLFIFNIFIRFNIQLRDIRKIFYFIAILTIIFVGLQFLLTNNFIIKIISNRQLIDYTGFRIGGPFVWSYIMSFILTPILFFILFELLNRNKNFTNISLFIILLIIILLSQSKAAYLFFFSSLLILFVTLLKYNYKKQFILLSLSTTILLFLIFLYVSINQDKFYYILNAYETYINGEIDASTNTRLSQLYYVTYTLNNNFLFGTPIDIKLIIENAYGHYLYYYGILGFLSFITLLFYILLKLYSDLKFIFSIKTDTNYRSISFAMFLYSIGLFIFSVAGSPLDAHKSSYLFLLILAIYSASIHKLKIHTYRIKENEIQ